MSRPFRILSLSGGGARGIFQATFLRELQKELNPRLKDGFDLIAGTSTGAIVALSLALDVPLDRTCEFYRDKAPLIFRSRFMAGVRGGPKYSNRALRQALEEIFSTKHLNDTDKTVIVAATTLDRFDHRIFSNIGHLSTTDGDLSAVDVALASAAAPTYFAPIQPNLRERTYVDGGVWANSPSLLAVLVAHRHLAVPLQDIRLLSVGTGYFPNGRSPRDMGKLRRYSLGSVRTVLELIFDSQSSFADEYARTLITPGYFIKIDVPLGQNMELDDVAAAVSILPALAEKEATSHVEEIRRTFLDLVTPTLVKPRRTPPNALITQQIPAAGLTAFYPSRDYYRVFRSASTVDAYVASALKSVVMVSINLMTGIPFHGLCESLKKKLDSDSVFSAVISLIDPAQEHLMSALAPALNMTAAALSSSIEDTLNRLGGLKTALSDDGKKRFSVRVHRAIPLGSAIMLDHNESYGRIQIETKIYKAPFQKSFAFEVAPTDDEGFYATLKKGYEDLLNDGAEVF
jgi:predicted acylesterase/phospholipase RssA